LRERLRAGAGARIEEFLSDLAVNGVDALYVNMAAIYDGPPESGGIPGC